MAVGSGVRRPRPAHVGGGGLALGTIVSGRGVGFVGNTAFVAGMLKTDPPAIRLLRPLVPVPSVIGPWLIGLGHDRIGWMRGVVAYPR